MPPHFVKEALFVYNHAMKITSAVFVRGVTNEESMVHDGLPQVAFIGRSNVGKSSVINSITNNKKLARSSSTAGRTQEINLFILNDSFYLVDLPGYGYARGSFEARESITERIQWYLFNSNISQYKVVLIIDGRTGMTESDMEMYDALKIHNKDIVIIINKVDKLNLSEKQKCLNAVKAIASGNLIIPYSAEKHTNRDLLIDSIFPISS